MKFGIIIGVLIGVVILGVVVIALTVLMILPATRSVSSAGNILPVPSITFETAAPAPVTSSPAVTPLRTSSAPHTISTSPAGKPAAAVNFSPRIVSIDGDDLTRTIKAQLANTGTADAHNVRARVEVYSQRTRIKINGRDYLEESLGTIRAGAVVDIEKTVTVSVMDSLKVLRDGASVRITVFSDEKNQSISYDYGP